MCCKYLEYTGDGLDQTCLFCPYLPFGKFRRYDVITWLNLTENPNKFITINWARVARAVVRALSSHRQCGPGFKSGVDAICGLSFLWVLSLALRGFPPGTPVFSSPQKPTLPNSNSIWNARKRLNEFLRTPKCFVGKNITINILQYVWKHFTCNFGCSFLYSIVW